MGYINWFEAHAVKHKKIVDKLLNKGCTKEQIIDYFDLIIWWKKRMIFALYMQKTKNATICKS